MKTEVLVAFGANLGDGEATFHETVRRLESDFGPITTSSLIRTPAVTTDGTKEPDYWNAILRFCVWDSWNPQQLLRRFLAIEQEFGRTRTTHWASRTVDLDLLFWNELFLDAAPELILPHPMIPWRKFVLEPACEIASEWVHPLTNQTLGEMYDHPQPMLFWDSMEPLPLWLLDRARSEHRPILARRWVCRKGESVEIFEKIKRMIEVPFQD